MRAGPVLAIVVALLALPSSAGAIAITAGPPELTNMRSATFTFALEELELPYMSYECRVDTGAWVACSSPFTFAGPLAAGAHDFTVAGVNGGVQDPNSAAHHLWTVDLTAPTLTITAGPSGTTTARSATFELSSNELGSTFLCSVDSTTLSPCTSPTSPFTSLAVGNHTFRVVTVDPAGNQSAQVTRTWTIIADNTPPETTITAAPSGLSNLIEPAVEFTMSEAGTFECSVNGGAFARCASPRILSALADGAITFHVRATDLAGNVDATPAAAGWTRDTAAPPPPAVFIGRRTRAAQKATALTAVFHTVTKLRAVWDRAPDAAATEVQHVSVPAGTDPEQSAWTPLQVGANTTRADVTVRPGKTGCVRARSVDAAGNASAWTRRCTTLPYKAIGTTVDPPFRKRTGSRYFAGQYVSYAGPGTRRGYLRLRVTPVGTGAEVKRVVVVATTCRRCGTLRIVVTGDGTAPVSEGDIVASRTLSLRSARTRRTRVLSAIRFDDGFPSLERRYVWVFASGGRGDRRIEGIGVSSL